MEYVEGVNLATLINACRKELGQPIPHRHVIFVVVEALKGLDYAHRLSAPSGELLNIVHRDVSPGNLLISFEGEVKVADFGIAKSTLRSIGSMSGTIKGKLPYMAPEQLRGSAVDKRADLYSVGAVLYEALTGRRVVPDQTGQAIPRILRGDFPRPREINGAISEELERIVLRALALDAGDRYPSAAAFRQDLEQLSLRQAYLLSSTDLADFVREVLGESRIVSPHDAPTLAASSEMPEIEADCHDAQTVARSSGNAFDALLGQELQEVDSAEGFSVFTSASGKRLVTSELGPSEGAAGVPTFETTPEIRGLRRRGRKFALALALLSSAAIGIGMAVLTGNESADALPPQDLTADVTAAAPLAQPTHSEAVSPQGSNHPSAEAALDASVREVVAATDPEPAKAVEGRSRERPPRRRIQGRGAPRREKAPEPRTVPGPRGSRISVNTDPWSDVFLDGRRLGPTPQLNVTVSPGRHRLVFRNESLGLEKARVITVASGEHERVTLNLR